MRVRGGHLALSVKFSLDCDSLAPIGAETAASGKLSYDASSGRYAYAWKTAKPYGNSCRRLELRFQEHPELTVNVTFRK